MAEQAAESTKNIDPELVARVRQKVLSSRSSDAKELAKWQKEKARPKRSTYLWYLMLILTLVYIVDEVATNLNSTIQSYMVEEFFVNDMGLDAQTAQARWQGYSALTMVSSVLVLFYRPLADRFGRKIFLVINTAAMGVGMLLCFWSPNFPVYLLGFFFLTFLTGPDTQVVYITETAPAAHRASFVSAIKGIAQLGIALIALGMDYFMKGNDSMWRWVFLVPACFGFAISFMALFLARETDQFLDERIAYLSLNDEDKIKLLLDKSRKDSAQKGGVLATAKFGFKHRQLRWLFIASMLYGTAFCATSFYGLIITDALSADPSDSVAQLSKMAFIWPFVCSFVTIIYGFFSDKIGRKFVSTLLGSLIIVGLLFMSLGLYFGWNDYLVGVFLGLFLAGYWNWGDTIILMVSESCPTNLRSSAAGDQNMFSGVGYALGYLTMVLYTNFAPVDALAYLDFLFLALAVPGVLGALYIINLHVNETRGLDLDKVRGDEWDSSRFA
jgi:MFS family permease